MKAIKDSSSAVAIRSQLKALARLGKGIKKLEDTLQATLVIVAPKRASKAVKKTNATKKTGKRGPGRPPKAKWTKKVTTKRGPGRPPKAG
jgi:hypothetical protein